MECSIAGEEYITVLYNITTVRMYVCVVVYCGETYHLSGSKGLVMYLEKLK